MEVYSLDSIQEALVDLEAVFLTHAEALANKKYAKCRTYSEKNVQLEDQGILSGELARPYYLWVDDKGNLRYRFKVEVVEVDGEDDQELVELMGYHSFDAYDLKAQFPEVFNSLDGFMQTHHNVTLRDFTQNAMFPRLNGKARLIELTNEAINNGRKMRACVALEVEGEAKDASYDKDEQFGIF